MTGSTWKQEVTCLILSKSNREEPDYRRSLQMKCNSVLYETERGVHLTLL